jgi:hypothetical protein
MKMPDHSTTTVDASLCEALSTHLSLYLHISDVNNAASQICQGKAGLRGGQSGEEARDKRWRAIAMKGVAAKFAAKAEATVFWNIPRIFLIIASPAR